MTPLDSLEIYFRQTVGGGGCSLAVVFAILTVNLVLPYQASVHLPPLEKQPSGETSSEQLRIKIH